LRIAARLLPGLRGDAQAMRELRPGCANARRPARVFR
jgi:hypothetical protein